MRYMLLMNYADTPGVPPMSEWLPEDARARGEAMMAIHQELTESGELVGTEGLTGPEAAKIVTHDGAGAPVVTDGPFAESRSSLPATGWSTWSPRIGPSRLPPRPPPHRARAAGRWARRSRSGR